MKAGNLIATVAAATLLGAMVAAPTGASSATFEQGRADHTDTAPPRDKRSVSDNILLPFQEKQLALQQEALQQKLRSGSAKEVLRVGKGQYAKVEQTGKDRIFVVLAEFGRTEHSAYPDGDSEAQRFNGPRHNQIPRPDRRYDNSTLWQRDYNSDHYRDMYFNRMRKYYEQQSSGRYTFGGQVTEWVKVPFNQARYGRDYCGSIVCTNVFFLLRDSLAYWVDAQLESGMTMRQIRRYLKTFDRQDRYDFDADGNFAEPDGYIDHFQIVHAGGDQAAGDPIYEGDAIWSHRAFAQINPGGTGPANGAQFGGVNVGEGGASDPDGSNVQIPDHKTGVWVGDYTIQPENGGLGVFAHEYGHDLGLPDLYDTSGNTGGAENSTAFWTLMSSGANVGRGGPNGIGDNPVDLGAWEKFTLGWLDYAVARPDRRYDFRLNPLSVNGRRPQALFVLLPQKLVQEELGEPCDTCGDRYYFSDVGDDVTNTMTRTVAGGGPLTAKVRYDIEEGYDYAFLESSPDGGETWEPVETNLSYTGDDGSGDNLGGFGISGTSNGAWVDLTADVPDGTDAVRFRYTTDTAVANPGFQVDNIVLDGAPIGTAETGPEGWVFDGFRTTTGADTIKFFNAYVVENRQYRKYDRSLRTAYNFGFAGRRADKVEFYPYQDGMLVNYWDSSHTDNNVGEHPGEGLLLPVDAHPTFHHTPDGALARPRILSYDSTFGLEDTDRLRLHFANEPYRIPSQENVPVFDDRRNYWYDFDEHGDEHPGRYQPGWYSVQTPRSGTRIRVVDVNRRGVMSIRVGRR
jgi:immune inhibitor A